MKAEHDLLAADPPREERQVARLRALAATARLDLDFAEKRKAAQPEVSPTHLARLWPILGGLTGLGGEAGGA